MNVEWDGEAPIDGDRDIVAARKLARDIAKKAGFGMTDVTRIVTAASELARNVVLHAESGVLRCRLLDDVGRVGMEFNLADRGPGIPDLEQAMQPGFSTSRGLGLGLPGTKRLMDEMEVSTEVGVGTTIVARKWRRR